MTPDAIREIYTSAYAETYNHKFLDSDLTRSDTKAELDILAGLLKGQCRWLDVACGSGYFLARFPSVDRTGLDLSPGMLAAARNVAPGVHFVEGNYLVPRPEWNNSFDVVSCMWYAYGYVTTLDEFDTLIMNLSDWVHPKGTLFLPYLQLLRLWSDIPFNVPYGGPGEVQIPAVYWTYQEPSGEKHLMISPHRDYIHELLLKRFAAVEIVEYPLAFPGFEPRRAFLATKKLPS